MASAGSDISVSLDERWTDSESERLAKWGVARSGLPSVGPPPAQLSRPAAGGGPAERSTVGRARALFNRVADTLTRARAAAASDEEEGFPQLDSARAEQLLADLDRAESGLYASGRAPVAYNRALVHLWSGGITPARAAIDRADCTSPSPSIGLNRRGLQVGCLWLRGRLAEAAERGSGVADLAAAVRAALQLRNPNQDRLIFTMRRSLHMLDADTADLWRDYLSALLSQADAKPLDQKRDPLVFDLAGSRAELEQQPELTAMLKMLLVRQGSFSLMKRLPGLDPSAGDLSRRLASVADVVAGMTADDSAPGLSAPADATELNNWVGHRCRRMQMLGVGGECAPATPEYAAWEETWQEALQAKIEGRSPLLARLWGGIVTGFLVILVALVLWALIVTFLLGLRREKLYLSKFEGHHFAESSRLSARRAKPKPARFRDD